MRYIGLDLTDPYAKKKRDVDVAVLDDKLRCDLYRFGTSIVSQPALSWLPKIGATPTGDDVVVIDGPLSLAKHPQKMRECERQLGAPGKTPSVLPVPGTGPFRGYVCGAVELAHKLRALGWEPMWLPTDMDRATMLEAYPGSAWVQLAGGPLPHKKTLEGRTRRFELLTNEGLSFNKTPKSDDELDAAMCAWLGLMARKRKVRSWGVPLQQAPADMMREGFIIGPLSASGAPTKKPPAPPAPEPVAKKAARALPSSDWVYFATPTRADRWETAELALGEGVIVRTAHTRVGSLVANVGQVQVGETILLAYRMNGTYEAIANLRVVAPTRPVPRAPALHRLDDRRLIQRISANYPPDPILHEHTAFLVEVLWQSADDERFVVPRPTGNNALWRSGDVGA